MSKRTKRAGRRIDLLERAERGDVGATMELNRRLVALGWMTDWPESTAYGAKWAAPGTWTLAGADLPRRNDGARRLGLKWGPEHGRCFVNARGRIVLANQIPLSGAVARAGEAVRYLDVEGGAQ